MTSQGIELSKFIEIKTQAVKRSPSLGKLPTLLITKANDSLLVDFITKNTSKKDVGDLYHVAGSVYDFASNYFSTSNRVGDYPDTLYICTWNNTKERKATLVGNNTPSLTELKKINGKFKITINKTTKDIDLNLTTKNSHTDIATEIANSIKKNNNEEGFKDATCVWNSIYNAFVVTAGSQISYITSPSSGTDISTKLGLHVIDGGRILSPVPKIDNLASLLDNINEYNGGYFVITLDFELTDAELTTFGKWINDSDNKYLGLYLSTNNQFKTQRGYTANYKKYNGLMLEYTSNYRQTNGVSAGIMSSIDYSKNDANINIAYHDFPLLKDYAISTTRDYENAIEYNHANSFVNTVNITKGYTWYLGGNIMGTNTTHTNIYISHYVIRTLLENDFSTFLTKNKFPSTSDSDRILQLVNSTMNLARTKSLLSLLEVDPDNPLESALDKAEALELSQTFPNLNELENSLRINGFYVRIGKFDVAKKCVNIHVVYVTRAPIKKICITMFPLRG